jgi:hypothetical protein
VIDDQVDVDERVHARGVAPGPFDRRPHRGEVDDGRERR